MKIEQLRHVVEIAKTNSISKAAEHLFTSQSNISFSVKQLEMELGHSIFDRSSAGTYLTEFGIIFEKKANTLIKQFDELASLGKEFGGNVEKLKISAIPTSLFFKIFTEYYSMYGNEYFRPQLFSRTSLSDVIEDVVYRKSDIGFVQLTDSNLKYMSDYFERRGLTFTEMFRTDIYAYISSQNLPLKNLSTEISVEKLLELPHLHLGVEEDPFFKYAVPEKLRKNPSILYFEDVYNLFEWEKRTDSYSLGIFKQYKNEFPLEGIRRLRIKDIEEHFVIGYITAKNYHNNRINQLIDLVNETT